MSFAVQDLSVTLGDREILREISFALPRTGLTGIVGANGSGKSTLLRALAGIQPVGRGRIALGGDDLARLSPRARARRIAMLPQTGQSPPGLTVRQLVARGRTPWLRPFLPMTAADHAAVQAAIERVGVAELADRPLDSLSGGQRQRAWIALVLAQETGAILLDEPLNFLDLPYQAALAALLRELRRDRAVVMILHDLTLAARLCDRILALRDGRLVAAGAVDEVLRPEILSRAFGIGFEVHDLPPGRDGAPRRTILPEGL